MDDLFDEIFVKENKENDGDNIEDLYSNIHDVQVAETVAQKLKALTADHDKLKSQNATLKSQILILKNLNMELSEKNKNLNNSLNQLVETARTEVNRKNDQIKSLRSELDDVLFKRAARSTNPKEVTEILERHKLPEEPFAKLHTQFEAKMREKRSLLASVSGAIIRPTSSPSVFTDGNIGNRQFVKKRKLETSPATIETHPAKKIMQGSGKDDPRNGDSTKAQPALKDVFQTDISLISRYVKDRKPKPKDVITPEAAITDRL